jgi:uncharacterized protein YecT (DUF1311 family)
MTKRMLCLAGFSYVLVSMAHAASFDCAKAARPVEKLICGDAKLNAADERLGQAYRAGLGKLPPPGVGPLRADQVQWLAWMQEICHAPQPGAAASKPVPAVSACMLGLYDERTKLLRGVATERDGVHLLLRTQYLAKPEPDAEGSPEYPGFGTLQVSWPLALDSSPDWAAWNHAAEAVAYDMAGDDVPKGTAAKLPQWTAELADEADTTITVHMLRVEHGRVTSAVAMNTMGHGAAHPNEAAATMTWLLQQHRALAVNDVFQPGSAWKKTVAQACWNAIHTSDQGSDLYEQVTGPDAKELQDVIANVGNWTLEHDGLHISYPAYSVAPRVAMLEDTVIPWTALQPVLARGFTAP